MLPSFYWNSCPLPFTSRAYINCRIYGRYKLVFAWCCWKLEHHLFTSWLLILIPIFQWLSLSNTESRSGIMRSMCTENIFYGFSLFNISLIRYEITFIIHVSLDINLKLHKVMYLCTQYSIKYSFPHSAVHAPRTWLLESIVALWFSSVIIFILFYRERKSYSITPNIILIWCRPVQLSVPWRVL